MVCPRKVERRFKGRKISYFDHCLKILDIIPVGSGSEYRYIIRIELALQPMTVSFKELIEGTRLCKD